MVSTLRYFDKLQYGDLSNLDVLVDPGDKSLWITYPTIEKVLSYEIDSARKKLTAKSLESFAGKGLAPGKTVKAIDSIGRPNTIKCVPFDTFLTLVHFEAFHGKDPYRKVAQGLLVAGFADSFSSLILEQCGIKLSKEERHQVITFYRHWYHQFQDWIRDTHLNLYGEKPSNEYYREMAVTINNYLFSKNHFYCDRLGNAETQELRVLENFQMQFMKSKSAKSGKDPLDAMRHYIAVLDSI